MNRFVVANRAVRALAGSRGGRVLGRRLCGPVPLRMFARSSGAEDPKDPKDPQDPKDPKDPNDNSNENFFKMLEDLRLNMIKLMEFIEKNVITLAVAALVLYLLLRDSSSEITFDQAVRLLESGDFLRLHIDERTMKGVTVRTFLKFITKDGKLWTESLDQDLVMKKVLELKKRVPEHKKNSLYKITQATTTQRRIDEWANFLMLIGLMSTLMFPLLLRRNGGMGVDQMEARGNYKIKKFNKDLNVKIRFKDIAGIDQTRQEIEEFVDFLKNKEKYTKVGAKLPKGALLSGPPGTGKTLLAKAVAGEAGVPFFFASGSEFTEMYVGLGAKRVRELFEEAKKSQSAIIFIDEIDAIGKKRSGKGSSNSESDATLNQLLVEMDGFKSSANVVVFAATNRKDLLDPALVRPGRFDRMIEINLPDISARAEIFAIHLKPLVVPEDAQKDRMAKRLAALTPGFSGADIANICNEAAIHAVRREKKVVEDYDFEMAVERVLGGLPMSKPITEVERRTVAIHESGHGVVSWFLKGASPLLKLTIIPRSKGSLGFAQYLPNEIPLQTEEYLINQIISILAGRAAEYEFFGKTSSGASDDLQKAYRIARAIVTKLGMSTTVGQAVYVENDYGIKDYSDAHSRIIDEEVAKIIKKCSVTAAEMVKEHRAKIERMAEELLAKETLDLKAIKAILGERPFPPEAVFRAYLEESGAN